jgi:predicted component of type VI protein secretion system
MSAKSKGQSRRKVLKEKTSQRYAADNDKALEGQLAAEFELDRQIQQHIGKWVAIADNRIVAVGDDVQEVMEASAKLGYALPLVVRGPLTAEETFYIL